MTRAEIDGIRKRTAKKNAATADSPQHDGRKGADTPSACPAVSEVVLIDRQSLQIINPL